MTEPNILSCLPEAFLSRMKEMLGNEYEAFLESYTRPRTFGLRLNTAKISAAEFEKIVPFPVTPIPWVKNAYFYPADVRPSRCPLYQAGLYYLQEPSAMTPASCLPAEPGDVVLDLCAAPGGKATALGSALKGEGLLVANDISASRARALLRNLELFGVTNSLIVNETPARLLERFPAYFSKILLGRPLLRGGDVPQGRGPGKRLDSGEIPGVKPDPERTHPSGGGYAPSGRTASLFHLHLRARRG